MTRTRIPGPGETRTLAGTRRGDPAVSTGAALLWALDAAALLGAGTMMARLVAGPYEFERLYGGSQGRLRVHRPVFRRVPGLPRDGMLAGEEEAAIAVIEQHLRKGGRR